MELSDRRRKLLFAGLVVVLVAVGVYLTMADSGTTTERAEPQGDRSTAVPAGPAAPSVPPVGIDSTITPENFDIYRLLPFPKRDFVAAAELAQRFTAAYGTYRYDEDPQAYMARLTPMVTEELGAEIARGASSPGLIEQRRSEQIVARSTATLDSVRDIEANSIIFLVTGNQQLTRSGETGQESKQFAVTVARDGAALRVYAFGPADDGQAGDTGRTGDEE
ncbi:hypothetical protein SAMN04489712_105225 [Thermomonospora echinospora]|uniref:Mce-associated membrane protein n=1 Tax=Thermomonospora echinospora TaxID=1992 RepID=A0A1H6A7E3_9ACTN|nr:hypothetical protein [Thermomonospora echinospora]SEG43957.1 hypothetical protein SAMN04489712_105225 [Thermomonospora echinospora]